LYRDVNYVNGIAFFLNKVANVEVVREWIWSLDAGRSRWGKG